MDHQKLSIYAGHLVLPVSHFVKTCGFCSSGYAAKQFCSMCEANLCQLCIQQHNQLKGFKKHVLVSLKERKIEEYRKCESCSSGEKAELRCVNCESTLCQTCIETHQRLKGLRDHLLVPLKIKEERKCQSCSSGENAELHCNDCESTLCRHCIETHQRLKGLKHHVLIPLKECGLCAKQITVEAYCAECNCDICHDCTRKHHCMKIFSQHKITTASLASSKSSSSLKQESEDSHRVCT